MIKRPTTPAAATTRLPAISADQQLGASGKDDLRVMTAPQPPDWLSGAYERAAWSAGYASAALHGGWHPVLIPMLELLANSAGRHCRQAMVQRAATADDIPSSLGCASSSGK